MPETTQSSSKVARRFAAGTTSLLVGLAILTPLVLATLGYFGLQFAMMTACTNEYSCNETLCSPCVPTFTWLTVGAAVQLLLIVGLVIVTVRFWRRRRRWLVAAALVVVAASLGTVVGTTWAADRAYCRPGDPGALTAFNDCGT